MENPIPIKVRGWLYVAGIIIGLLVASVVPDILTALGVGAAWITVAARFTGALTALLSMLSRANLTEPAVLSAEVIPAEGDESAA